jgi:DNA-binding IclR family transcriptional regulator
MAEKPSDRVSHDTLDVIAGSWYTFYMKNAICGENSSNHSPAPAVERAFAILRLLSQTKEPQGVSALARSLSIGKSTVHGILQALLTSGAIEDAGGRQFRLGPLVEELGRSRRGTRSLTEICKLHLAELVEQTGQTSVFGQTEGDRFRIVTVVEGQGPLRVKAVQGASIPLLAGVVGKIALAWEMISMPAALPRFTEDSVVDTRALKKELRQVRAQALALDHGEYLRGVYAAASPVLREDRVVGIVFCAGFQDQVGEEGLMSLGQAVLQAASAISREFEEWRAEL